MGGFVVSLVDDGLRVEQVDKLTLATKKLISENESAIIAVLRQWAEQKVTQRVCDVPVTSCLPAPVSVLEKRSTVNPRSSRKRLTFSSSDPMLGSYCLASPVGGGGRSPL